MAVLFTGDTHFGDTRVLRIDRRPFASVAEHDAALVARWNAAVAPDDVVWHLGDFALGPSEAAVHDLLAGLNGTKHLIIGNNDSSATLRAPGWASVQHYAELEVDGRELVLCHYAFRTWNHMGRGVINLHGHSHGKLKPATRQYDVGVDVFPFRPVSLADILASRTRRAASVVRDGGG
jgi:calcineurin-like phosphoesterase family protein